MRSAIDAALHPDTLSAPHAPRAPFRELTGYVLPATGTPPRTVHIGWPLKDQRPLHERLAGEVAPPCPEPRAAGLRIVADSATARSGSASAAAKLVARHALNRDYRAAVVKSRQAPAAPTGADRPATVATRILAWFAAQPPGTVADARTLNAHIDVDLRYLATECTALVAAGSLHTRILARTGTGGGRSRQWRRSRPAPWPAPPAGYFIPLDDPASAAGTGWPVLDRLLALLDGAPDPIERSDLARRLGCPTAEAEAAVRHTAKHGRIVWRMLGRIGKKGRWCQYQAPGRPWPALLRGERLLGAHGPAAALEDAQP